MRYALYLCILVFGFFVLYWGSFLVKAIDGIRATVCELKDGVGSIQKDMQYYGRQTKDESNNP